MSQASGAWSRAIGPWSMSVADQKDKENWPTTMKGPQPDGSGDNSGMFSGPMSGMDTGSGVWAGGSEDVNNLRWRGESESDAGGASGSVWSSGIVRSRHDSSPPQQWGAPNTAESSTWGPVNSTSGPMVDRSLSIGGWGADVTSSTGSASLWGDTPIDATSTHSWSKRGSADKEVEISSNKGSVSEDPAKKEENANIARRVNSHEGWGRRPVDQSTPWDIDDLLSMLRERNKPAESNVWASEPPTGTGIWEAHYENLGEKTARWQNPNNVAAQMNGPASQQSWDQNSSSGGGMWPESGRVGSNWDANSDAASFWSGDKARRRPDNNWDPNSEDISSSKWAAPPGRTDDGTSIWGHGNQMPMDVPETSWNRQDPYGRRLPLGEPIVNPNRIKVDQQMRVQQVKYLMNQGFRREDAQTALINNNMDLNKALIELRERQMSGALNPDVMNNMDDMRFPGMRNMSNDQMKQQIMNQMRFALNNRMPGPSNSPMLSDQVPNSIVNPRGAPNHQMAALQQREAQIRRTLAMLFQKYQDTKLKIAEFQSNQNVNVMPPTQLRQITHELEMQLQQFAQQINAQESQLKLVHSQLQQLASLTNSNPPQQASSFQQQNSMPGHAGMIPPLNSNNDMISQQMADMKLQTPSLSGANTNNQWKPPPPSLYPHNLGGGAPSNQADANSLLSGISLTSPPTDMKSNIWHEQQCSTHNDVSGTSAAGGFNSTQRPGMNSGNAMHTSSSSPALVGGNNTVDIPEFVPGQPWQGGISNKDDPHCTPGSARGLLTVQNDHLERLANSESSSKQMIKGFSMNNGVTSNWLLIRNLLPHITLDMLRSAFANQVGVQMHPNLYGRWVLVRFMTPDDAAKALHSLAGRVGTVEAISDIQASQKLQEIQNLAARFNLSGPSNGPSIDWPDQQRHEMHMSSHNAI